MHLLITDGGNRHDITYGSYKIFDEDGELIKHTSMIFGYGTSNLAEYLALIDGVKALIKLEIKDVVILTDSKLMQKQILGDWACNYPHLKAARDKARRLLGKFNSWKINKVSRNIIASHLGH